ncbi:MAG: LysR family transcriptional regulator [Flavobacteriaceae bacterium]|nr:LysR family transcriptional regulator [Flavobacteriaceae bacterium]
MQTNWLKDFIALSESQNFSATALQRFTSQSALSRRIRQLEEWVGETLIDRNSNSRFLTQAGETFLPFAQKALLTLNHGAEMARIVSDNEDQQLRIAITHALSLTFFPKWFRHIGGAVNASSVQLMADTAQTCLHRFQEQEVQFCITYAEHTQNSKQSWQHREYKTIGQDKLVAVYQQAQFVNQHPEAKFGSSSLPFLYYSEQSGLSHFLHASTTFQQYQSQLTPYLCAPNASVLKNLTLQGLGVAWLPHSLIEQDLASGTLSRVPSMHADMHLEIRLYRQSVSLNNAAETLWSSL